MLRMLLTCSPREDIKDLKNISFTLKYNTITFKERVLISSTLHTKYHFSFLLSRKSLWS